uniref:Uncharacterized protein n=1 Tax=Onchocerca volvulus TaxID=6282 RepID=A0A8R1TJA8_ONCVO
MSCKKSIIAKIISYFYGDDSRNGYLANSAYRTYKEKMLRNSYAKEKKDDEEKNDQIFSRFLCNSKNLLKFGLGENSSITAAL